MSTIDLILLGSLCQSPKSAYDLQKQIEARNLSRWIKIGSFTVYKKVVQYETKGYVVSKTIRNGNMPEKTLYTITPRGKDTVKELMTQFSLAETRVFLDFNAVIVNLALADESFAKECIGNIKNSTPKSRLWNSSPRTRTYLFLDTLFWNSSLCYWRHWKNGKTALKKNGKKKGQKNEHDEFCFNQFSDLSAIPLI